MTHWSQRIKQFREDRLDGQNLRLRTFLLSSRVTSSLLGLAQLAVLARILPASQFGLVAAASAAAAYISMLGDPAVLGYERLGHHDPAKDHEAGQARSVANSVTLLLMAVAPVTALVVGAVTGDVLFALAVAIWAISLVQVRWISIQYLNWHQQTHFARTLLVNSATRVAAMLAAAVLTESAVVVLIVGGIGSLVVTGLVGPKRAPLSLDRRMLRQLLAIGAPMAVASAAVQSMGSYPTLVAHAALPTEAFANFAAQSSLAGAFFGVTVGFVLVFGWPQAKKCWDSGDHDGAHEVIHRYARYVFVLGTAATVFMWFFGDLVTRLILGSAYVGHAIPAYVIAAASLTSMAGISSWHLRLRFRHNTWAAIAVGAAVLQLPVVWFAARPGELTPILLSMLAVSWLEATVALWAARPPRILLYWAFGTGAGLVAAACAVAAA